MSTFLRPPPAPSPEEIEAAKTQNGDWSRETLERWGLAWPPRQGWRERLEERWIVENKAESSKRIAVACVRNRTEVAAHPRTEEPGLRCKNTMKSALVAHTDFFVHEKSSLGGEGTGLSRSNDFSCLVMASDEGKGMRSSVSKCLHRVAGKPLLVYTLESLKEARPRSVALVAGADLEQISEIARSVFPEIEVFHQSEHRGTADALMCARHFVDSCPDDLIVAYADTPFIQTTTYARLRTSLFYGAAIGIVGFTSLQPQGFGRIIQSVDGRITAIREEAFLNVKERLIQLCNAGPLALEASARYDLVKRLERKLASEGAEITDLVSLAHEAGHKVRMQSVGEEEAFAVNNRIQLSLAERVMQDRLRQAAMLSGVTMIDPESVTLCHDTLFGQDVVIEPNVVFGPKVFVQTGARVASFSYFEDCTVRSRSTLS